MKPQTIIRHFWLKGFVLFALSLASTLSVAAQSPEPGQAVPEGNSIVGIISPDGRSNIETAPVTLTVRLSRGANPIDFRAFLNRREIGGKFVRSNPSTCAITSCELTAVVYPADGLVKGSNELSIEVTGRDASHERVIRRFFVQGPKADAGTDLKTRVGQAVQLDGSKSTSGSGYSLSHEWVLVQQPAGSKAVLSNQSSPTPSLVPDINGKYLAKLVVDDGYFGSDPEMVTLNVTPTNILVPVQTQYYDSSGDYAIVFNGQFYRGLGATDVGLQILVLDRATLEFVDFRFWGPIVNNAAGSSTACINAYLNSQPDLCHPEKPVVNIDSSKIVIVSTPPDGGWTDENDNPSGIAPSLESLGATSEFRSGNQAGFIYFTLIGIKGFKQGQAYQHNGTFPNQFDPDDPDIYGYFVPDSTGEYIFHGNDILIYQTRGANSSGLTNTMTVDGIQYPAPPLPAGSTGGFQVLTLDRETLNIISNNSYGTNSPGKSMLFEMERMAGDLTSISNAYADRAMVLVSSIGGPLPGDADGQRQLVRLPCVSGAQSCLPGAMGKFGANPYVFSSLGPNDTYSLVGSPTPVYPNAPPFRAIESSSVISQGSKGAVRGVLARDRRHRFAPTAFDNDPNSEISYELYSLAWQIPGVWPMVDTPGRQAAYTWISSKVCCDDVRANAYTNVDNTVSNWQNKLTPLVYPDGKNQPCPSTVSKDLDDPRVTDIIGFSFSDFCDVKQQLSNEFDYVANVRTFRTNMLLMFDAQGDTISSTLTSVYTDVTQSFTVPPEDKANKITLEVFGAVLTILSAIPNPVVAAAADVANAALTLATELASTPQSDPRGNIFTDYGHLSDDAVTYFEQAQQGFEVIVKALVTDWAKLEAVGKHIGNNDPNWTDDPTKSQLLPAFDKVMRAEYYSKLLPLAYVINDLNDNQATDVGQVQCSHPDSKHEYSRRTLDSWVGYPTQYIATLNDFNDLFTITEPKTDSEGYYIFPPPSLTDTLFKTMGVPKIQFYTQWPSFKHRKGCTTN